MGITEDLEDIKKLLTENKEKKKTKKFRIPFGKEVGRSQMRKNYVTVVLMNENQSLRMEKVQIEDQSIVIDKIPRLASAGYVWYFKRNPWIFLPSWSVQPISAKQEALNAESNGALAIGYATLLAKMESQVQKPKGQISGVIKWLFGLGVLAVVIWAFMSGGG